MTSVLQGWRVATQHLAYADRPDGRRLAIVINVIGLGDVRVACFETSTAATTAAAVFDDHTHKLLGRHRTQAKARQTAERFARRWMKHHPSTKVAACDCPELEAPR